MPFPLLQEEMDAIYDLDYMRTYHPAYEKYGGVPAIEEVQFSVISCRGCFGSCSFCAIHSHQGRIIQTRSHESIVREAKKSLNCQILRGIYMMLAVRLPISDILPVPSN